MAVRLVAILYAPSGATTTSSSRAMILVGVSVAALALYYRCNTFSPAVKRLLGIGFVLGSSTARVKQCMCIIDSFACSLNNEG